MPPSKLLCIFVENKMKYWNMRVFNLFHFHCDFLFVKNFISHNKFKQECLGDNLKNSSKMQGTLKFARGNAGGKKR